MLRTLVFGFMGLTVSELAAQYKETYVRDYLDIAISEMHRTGIPASIKLSQAILESNYGRSELAREAHNHFGMKCGREWGGKAYHLKDDDYDSRGELVNSCFRVFTSVEESYVAHSDFLTDPAKAHRYGALFNLAPDDYEGWAVGLKQGGYATNPDYARLLIKIIEEQRLYQYDVPHIDQDLASTHHRNKDDRNRPNINETLTRHDAYVIQFQNEIPFIAANSGDNIKSVSKQTDVPVRQIIRYNEFVDSRRTQLEEGDRIYLQPLKRKYSGNQNMHVVEQGETIAMIAHYYGVKSDVLRKRNNLAEGCEPAPGSKLVLRGKQKHEIHCTSVQTTLVMASAPKSTPKQPVATPVPEPPVATEVRNSEPRTETEQKPETTVLKASTPGLSDDFVRSVMSYTVQPKDTLYQIATRHGITVSELKKLNNLEADTIHPGQSLRIQKQK